MVSFSVRHDPVPASVKIDLELHKPYRTWFGLGRLRCEWCHHTWGAHGCPQRRSAVKLLASCIGSDSLRDVLTALIGFSWDGGAA
ncbi:hypothetical protein [Glycomyces albidus]|uniref:Uncharacterized protein n=1 Tax=Glycomyces albidus TaxID=2656774 RepID=A0A6L5GAV8_9ACTN|nr:hypothetical protein [Glycomyces albidus]MQM26794.1 hypothetical protein [Glycomyces albidus]